MKILSILMGCGACLIGLAQPEVYFADLDVEIVKNQIRVRAQPRELGPSELLRSYRQPLKQTEFKNPANAEFEQIFDGLSRRVAEPIDESFDMVILYELELRDMQGRELDRLEHEVVYRFSDPWVEVFWGDNVFELSSDHQRYIRFSRQALRERPRFESLLRRTLIPDGEAAFALPSVSEFVVDLRWRSSGEQVFGPLDSMPQASQTRRFAPLPGAMTWADPSAQGTLGFSVKMTHDTKIRSKASFSHRYPFPNFNHSLGKTLCYRIRGSWFFARSMFFHRYRDAIEAQLEVQALAQQVKDSDAHIHSESKIGQRYLNALEDYLELVPSDARAWARMANVCLALGREKKAQQIMDDYAPFFTRDSKRVISNVVADLTDRLLDRTAHFSPAEYGAVRVLRPQPDEMVAGNGNLVVELKDQGMDLLRVDASLDSEIIGSLSEPPFEFPFSVNGKRGEVRLRVRALFRNETYEQVDLPIRTLEVHDQTEVTLVALRLVVTHRNRFVTDLSPSEVKIDVGSRTFQPERFERDTSPLKIVILMDNSYSMLGSRSHLAQFALHSLIPKMRPVDRASVFSFDNKVLRISDFTNRYHGLIPMLYTVEPRGLTAMADGLLVAFNQIRDHNGTKVIIVVSDGLDTFSLANFDRVKRLLAESDVMVYAITLGSQNRRLKKLAALTGSVYTDIEQTQDLPATLARIYEELRSFYYLDFYADLTESEVRKMKLDFGDTRGRGRFRVISR